MIGETDHEKRRYSLSWVFRTITELRSKNPPRSWLQAFVLVFVITLVAGLTGLLLIIFLAVFLERWGVPVSALALLAIVAAFLSYQFAQEVYHLLGELSQRARKHFTWSAPLVLILGFSAIISLQLSLLYVGAPFVDKLVILAFTPTPTRVIVPPSPVILTPTDSATPEATAPVSVPVAPKTTPIEIELPRSGDLRAVYSPRPTATTTPSLTPESTVTTAPSLTPTPSQTPTATPTLVPAPRDLNHRYWWATPAPDEPRNPIEYEWLAEFLKEYVKLYWRWSYGWSSRTESGWKWNSVGCSVAKCDLGPDEHIDVLLWRVGEEPRSVGWTDIPMWLGVPPRGPGDYLWQVQVIRGKNGVWEANVSNASEVKQFKWPTEPK